MIEKNVSDELSGYFASKGLEVLGKFDAFNHHDDTAERSFEIDLAIGPSAKKGDRNIDECNSDRALFNDHSDQLDSVFNELLDASLFPNTQTSRMSWSKTANPNPVVGIAVEIENNMSKYLLGSLLASSIAGRWGIVVIPDCTEAPRWIQTIKRMMHKGTNSPIPQNIAIFSWPKLQSKIKNG